MPSSKISKTTPDVATYPTVVILARAGSKGIKAKNIQKVGGFSLVERSIITSMRSRFGEEGDVFVYSDCEKTLQIADKHGAIALEREAEWATDEQGSEEIVAHFLDNYHDFIFPPDPVCLVQPTSPFLRPDDLNEGLKVFESADYDSAISATRFHGFIGLGGSTNTWEAICPRGRPRRQEMTPLWLETGMFYLARREDWLAGRRFGDAPGIVEVEDSWRAVEVDDPVDLAAARCLSKIYDRGTWVEKRKARR